MQMLFFFFSIIFIPPQEKGKGRGNISKKRQLVETANQNLHSNAIKYGGTFWLHFNHINGFRVEFWSYKQEFL